jgi:hypothetical protein
MRCATSVYVKAYIGEIMERTFLWTIFGRLIKKERNHMEIFSPHGYAQQEVHPCPLDYKARYAVARLFQSQPLNMLHNWAIYV